eukprot:3558866-Pyramimonas_sp.AAC.1
MASGAAVSLDIATFIQERNGLLNHLLNGKITYRAAADLVLHLLGTVDAVGPLSSRTMSRKVKALISRTLASRPDGNLFADDFYMDISMLPIVLNEMASTEVTDDDIKAIVENLTQAPGQEARRPAKKRRTWIPKESAATRAPALLPLSDSAPAASADMAASPAGASIVVRPEDHYSQFDASDMRSMLVDRDNTINDLKNELRLANRMKSIWRAKAEQARQDTSEVKSQLAETLKKINFRPNREITTYGGYSLARARNVSHTSAAATACMVAGDPLKGGLHDKAVVLKYEHRLAAAKTIRSMDFYENLEPTDLCMHTIKCDATNSNAIERSKVHVSIVMSVACFYEQGREDLEQSASPEDIAKHCDHIRTVGDLQIVGKGTGTETHRFCQRELASVGCPVWSASGPAVHGHGNRLTVYVWGVDAGGENKTLMRHVKAYLLHAPHVGFHASFCILHQQHII